MILERETYNAFGYCPKDLPEGSNKTVLVSCESCGKIRKNRFAYQHRLCRSCSKTGIRNQNYGKTGEANSNWRGGKVKRICKTCKNIFHVDRNQVARGWGDFCSPSCAKTGSTASDATKALMSAAHKGEKHWNWQGGLSYGKYCRRFNRHYKRKIRERFDNKCFLCGKTEEENCKTLSVHHVDYNKDCDCDNTKCVCVPLCISCHAKTNKDRDYWENKIKNMLKQTLFGYL
jgi:hypothetical protein